MIVVRTANDLCSFTTGLFDRSPLVFDCNCYLLIRFAISVDSDARIAVGRIPFDVYRDKVVV